MLLLPISGHILGSLCSSSPHQGTFWGPLLTLGSIFGVPRVLFPTSGHILGSPVLFSPTAEHILGSPYSFSLHQSAFWGPLLTLGSIFGVPRMLFPHTKAHFGVSMLLLSPSVYILGSPPHIRIHFWGPSGALPHTRAHFGVSSPLLPHSRAHFGVSILLLSPSECILGSPPHIRIHFWGP